MITALLVASAGALGWIGGWSAARVLIRHAECRSSRPMTDEGLDRWMEGLPW
jgi:hypothetical protein